MTVAIFFLLLLKGSTLTILSVGLYKDILNPNLSVNSKSAHSVLLPV